MKAIEDIPSHTPVLARKQWLQNAFKPTEKNRAPAPGHDLVHSRLSWLEEQKRKSRATMSPNNKDASNIPEHLVEDRKKWLDDELRQMLKRTEENRRHSFPTRRFASMGNLARSDSRNYSDLHLGQSYSYDMHDMFAGEYMVGPNYAMPCSTTSTDTDMTSSNYSNCEFKGFLHDGSDLSMDEAVPFYFDQNVSTNLQRYITQVNEDVDFKIVNIGHLDGQKANERDRGSVQKTIQMRGGISDLISPSSSLADYARHSAHTFSQTQLGVVYQEDDLVPHPGVDYSLRTPPRKKSVHLENSSRVRGQKATQSKKRVQQPTEVGCTCAIM